MTGNRIAVVTDHPEDLVEVHPPPVNSVNMVGVMIEYHLLRRRDLKSRQH